MELKRVNKKSITYIVNGVNYKDSWKLNSKGEIILTSKNLDTKSSKIIKFNTILELYLMLLAKFDLQPSKLEIVVSGKGKEYTYNALCAKLY